MWEQFLCLSHSHICSESYCCDYKGWLRLRGQKRHNSCVRFCIRLGSFMQMLIIDTLNGAAELLHCMFLLHAFYSLCTIVTNGAITYKYDYDHSAYENVDYDYN